VCPPTFLLPPRAPGSPPLRLQAPESVTTGDLPPPSPRPTPHAKTWFFFSPPPLCPRPAFVDMISPAEIRGPPPYDPSVTPIEPAPLSEYLSELIGKLLYVLLPFLRYRWSKSTPNRYLFFPVISSSVRLIDAPPSLFIIFNMNQLNVDKIALYCDSF